MDLLAGFELFTRAGTALPEATIECVFMGFTAKWRVWTSVLTRFTVGPCGNRIVPYLVPSGWPHTLRGFLERSSFWLTVFRNVARRRKGFSDIRRPSLLSVRSSTSMPTSGPYYPCVSSYPRSALRLVIQVSLDQVSKDPSQKPDVDLVVVRENTECLVCLYVFQPHRTLDTIRLRCG